MKNGKFIFKNLSPGTDELIIESPGYQIFTQNILIKKGEKIDLGNIALIKAAGVVPKSEENIRLFDESDLDDDDNVSSQSASYLAGASDDVFLNAASY